MKRVTHGRRRFVTSEPAESINPKAATHVDLCTAGEWPPCLLFLSYPVYMWGCRVTAYLPDPPSFNGFSALDLLSPIFSHKEQRKWQQLFLGVWGHIWRGARQRRGLCLMGYLLARPGGHRDTIRRFCSFGGDGLLESVMHSTVALALTPGGLSLTICL